MTKHTLPALPYDKAKLTPYMSAETFDFHYGKHHQAYVDNLNKFIENTEFADKSLVDIIKSSPAGAIFNNSAQVYNHTFFWHSLTTPEASKITEDVEKIIKKSFADVDTFKAKFTESAMKVFGSGWTWLVKKPDGSLDIVNTANADTPIRGENKPLLCVDIWEHAYYIDYRNARAKYLENIWHIINWQFIKENY